MPQMKPTFWLDVLTSNSLCLISVMSLLYFSPLLFPSPFNYNNYIKKFDNQESANQWPWKW